jgi:hypothetical protein
MAAGCGFQGHGKVCVFYTPAQVVTMRQAELDKMSNLAGGMQDGDDTDEETNQFACGVRFGRATTLGPNPRCDLSPPRNPPGLTSESLFGAFEEATQKPRQTCDAPPPKGTGTTDTPLWFGLEDSIGKRWVLTDPAKVQQYISTKVFQLEGVFDSQPEADEWKQNRKTRAKASKSKPEEISISDDSGGGSEPKDSDDSSSGDSDSSEEPRKQKKKPTSKPSKQSRK